MRTGCAAPPKSARCSCRTRPSVNELWTPRVWPGAVLVAGEIVGTWRRAQRKLTVQAWRKLSPAEREAVVAEAEALPLPDPGTGMAVTWS